MNELMPIEEARAQVLAAVTLAWVIAQGAFGALTVTWKLYPAIVTGHLMGGMGLLAFGSMIAVAATTLMSTARLEGVILAILAFWLDRGVDGLDHGGKRYCIGVGRDTRVEGRQPFPEIVEDALKAQPRRGARK